MDIVGYLDLDTLRFSWSLRKQGLIKSKFDVKEPVFNEISGLVFYNNEINNIKVA